MAELEEISAIERLPTMISCYGLCNMQCIMLTQSTQYIKIICISRHEGEDWLTHRIQNSPFTGETWRSTTLSECELHPRLCRV